MVASSSRPHAASASVSAAPPTHLSTFPPPSSAAVASRLAGGQRLSRDLRDAIEARWRHDAAATDEFARVFSETAARHGATSEARHRSSAQQPSSPPPPPPTPTPRARVDARASSSSSSSSSSPSSRPMATTPSHRKLRERLDACDVSGVDAASIDWSALASVISSEAVAALGARGRGEAEGDGDDDADARVAFEVNSGGAVFFCIFSSPPPPSSEPAPEPATERVLVVKFCSDRLAAQSEYFAHEIASALGVDVPETRLFRRKPAAGGGGGGGERGERRARVVVRRVERDDARGGARGRGVARRRRRRRRRRRARRRGEDAGMPARAARRAGDAFRPRRRVVLDDAIAIADGKSP